MSYATIAYYFNYIFFASEWTNSLPETDPQLNVGRELLRSILKVEVILFLIIVILMGAASGVQWGFLFLMMQVCFSMS